MLFYSISLSSSTPSQHKNRSHVLIFNINVNVWFNPAVSPITPTISASWAKCAAAPIPHLVFLFVRHRRRDCDSNGAVFLFFNDHFAHTKIILSYPSDSVGTVKLEIIDSITDLGIVFPTRPASRRSRTAASGIGNTTAT